LWGPSVYIGITRQRSSRGPRTYTRIAGQWLDAYWALPSDTGENAFATNGIQEVDGSIPFSSTNKINGFGVSFLEARKHV
jgi:hypothetical protein